ncbi:hypothetical protein [Streptomyces bauhiniae]|uniref:hypothetical protein n=1 Tax=Streptomyces bauhiniae TaxID=2340725 RepID=UPI0035D76F64
MSWDVVLLRLPDDVASMDTLPPDYTPTALGRHDEVLAAVTHAVPGADLSDPTWGDLSGPTWSIELNIGPEDPVDSIMLHIRGSGDNVLVPVLRLAQALRCKALDLSEGVVITQGQTSGWHAFQQFRGRVIGSAR